MVAGCSTESCTNPSEAGFFDGIANLSSGCYAAEEVRLEKQLREAEGRRAQLHDEAAAIEARAANLEGEVATRQRRLARLQRDLAEASAALDRARAKNQEEQAELDALRQREAEVTLTLVAAGERPPQSISAADIDGLEAENADLRAQIHDALVRLGQSG